MKKIIIAGTSVLTLLATSSIALTNQGASAAATSGLGQGVTASTIKVGISVVDLSAIAKAGGAPLDQGTNRTPTTHSLRTSTNTEESTDARSCRSMRP